MSSSKASAYTPQTLAGHLYVVTGSSTGIGRSIAVTLAAAGANVVLHGRASSPSIEETAAEIEQLGRKAYFAFADLQTQTLWMDWLKVHSDSRGA